MISVIVPVYNGERHLEACLNSVAHQTGVELEILVIDDGSRDGTYQICKTMAEKDTRIRLFRQENAGVSAARNYGLQEAAGEYVLFVDADDRLPPGAMEILWKAARNGADFVRGAHMLFRGNRTETQSCPGREMDFSRKTGTEPLEDWAPLVCGQLYRRDVIRKNGLKFPEGVSYGEDTLFNLEYARFAQRGSLLEDVVYFRRKGGVASSIRYYPRRGELALGLIAGYAAYFGGWTGAPDRLETIARREIMDAVSHYLIHCPVKMARQKTEYLLHLLAGTVPEQLLPKTAKMAMRQAVGQNFSQILLRRLRRLFRGIPKERVKRIGIVTVFDNRNLGNRLQNYALQQVLLQYGDRVVTIKNKPAPRSLPGWLLRGTPLAESIVLNSLAGEKRKSKLLSFNREHLLVTGTGYCFDRAYTRLKKRHRCHWYCAGSDQIWNPDLNRTGPFSYLAFAPPERTFSYAASFGREDIPGEQQRAVKQGLQHMHHLSLREPAGARIVRELTGREDGQVLPDPTLLLTEAQWKRIMKAPGKPVPQSYLLAYFLGPVSPERRESLRRLAEAENMEILELMDPDSPCFFAGPEEFLWLIQRARLVCTDSFHGSVFAFLFQRPLVIFDREGEGAAMGSRLDALAETYGLKDHRAKGGHLPENLWDADYRAGFKALAEERCRAREFLDGIFSGEGT